MILNIFCAFALIMAIAFIIHQIVMAKYTKQTINNLLYGKK